jgi:hypothetical protein
MISLSKGGGEYPKNEYVISLTNSYSSIKDVGIVKYEIKAVVTT